MLYFTFSGMVRGAIAYALILHIESCAYDSTDSRLLSSKTLKSGHACLPAEENEVLTSTTLMLIWITTIIFATTMRCT